LKEILSQHSIRH